MQVKVLRECGYEESALGFSLSYNSTVERAKELFPAFAFKQGGENKFLESIYLWMDVDAPRFWWQEADTYRVGTSKQSESTMHTISKRDFTVLDFEYLLYPSDIAKLNRLKNSYNLGYLTLGELKNALPEGFLQRRIWCMNYKSLQNVYNQRKNHKLLQWKYFLQEVIEQIEHPEFIVGQKSDIAKWR